MKKLIAMILAGSILCGMLAGCAKEEEVAPEITVMGNARMYDGEEDAWNEIAASFEEETGIKVNYRWQGTWSEVPQNLTTAQMANESVDLVTVGAGLINSSVAASGLLMDITDLIEPQKDRFTDGMLDAYTIGGKVWGFPYGSSSAGFFYYNKTLFDELGITEEPKTFDELVAVSQIISDAGLTPMAFRGKDASYWPNWFFYTYSQTTGNQPMENLEAILTGEDTFENQAVVDAINGVKAFYDEGVLTPDCLDTNGDGMKALFMQGDAAMMHTHNFQLLPDQVEFELGIIEFPLITDDASLVAQAFGGPGTGIAIPSFANKDNLDNTMKFVEYLLAEENVNTILSCYNPVVDAVKGVEVLDEPIVKELNETLIPKTLTYLDWIWPAEVQDAFVLVMPAVIVGDMTAEDAAATIQESLETIREQRAYRFDWWNEWSDEDWANVASK